MTMYHGNSGYFRTRQMMLLKIILENICFFSDEHVYVESNKSHEKFSRRYSGSFVRRRQVEQTVL